MEAGSSDSPQSRVDPGGPAAAAAPDAVADRVNAVIAAAEQAAAAIREDAESEARTQLAGSRDRAELLVQERARAISELTDALLAHATSVRREFDALMRVLEEGRAQLGLPGPARPAVQAPPAPPPQAAPPPPAPQAAPESPLPPRAAVPPVPPDPAPAAGAVTAAAAGAAAPPDADEDPETRRVRDRARARLVAMQMALAGRGRDEIEARLRQQFGISDPAPVIDELGGSVPL